MRQAGYEATNNPSRLRSGHAQAEREFRETTAKAVSAHRLLELELSACFSIIGSQAGTRREQYRSSDHPLVKDSFLFLVDRHFHNPWPAKIRQKENPGMQCQRELLTRILHTPKRELRCLS